MDVPVEYLEFIERRKSSSRNSDPIEPYLQQIKMFSLPLHKFWVLVSHSEKTFFDFFPNQITLLIEFSQVYLET